MKLGRTTKEENTPLVQRPLPFDQKQELLHQQEVESKHHLLLLWALVGTGIATLIFAVIMATVHSFPQSQSVSSSDIPQISVAFIGNSML
jgi:hypothetical protein